MKTYREQELSKYTDSNVSLGRLKENRVKTGTEQEVDLVNGDAGGRW